MPVSIQVSVGSIPRSAPQKAHPLVYIAVHVIIIAYLRLRSLIVSLNEDKVPTTHVERIPNDIDLGRAASTPIGDNEMKMRSQAQVNTTTQYRIHFYDEG